MKTNNVIVKRIYIILSICILVSFHSLIYAKISLPSIFGHHMVIQQKSNVAIWGMALENTEVSVITSWDNRTYYTQSDAEGRWRLAVKTPSAGGPFNITISDGESLTLNDILIGEVWLCSGQSNMQMPMKGYRNQPILGANEAIATSTNKSIRLFTVHRGQNMDHMADIKGEWISCKPENVVDFSATAYFFGQFLQKAIGVPIGIICSSLGGSRIEPWMSESGFEKYNKRLNLLNKPIDYSKHKPSELYNSMIAPMAGFAIAGCIWYQGEANRKEPGDYEKLLPGLIENWREEWGIGEFPFFYVQIAPYNYGEVGMNSAFIREAMLNASDDIPNIGMTCSIDIGEKDCIHPTQKETVGKRLAYMALARTYDMKGIEDSGPLLKDMVIEGQMVKLTFDHAQNGLTTYGKELKNFEIAGENQRFYQAEAFITKEGITIISPLKVDKPVAVRYAFKDFVVGELYNTEGLPASSFRTDNWEN